MLIVGLISGTSADGMDAALVRINGAPPTLDVRLIKHITTDYSPALREAIFAGFRPESSSVDRLSRLNRDLGLAAAEAVQRVVSDAGYTLDQIDLVGSHGQTLWYDAPAAGELGTLLTLGEPAIIAERTGITTISHFRENDMAAGGRGAPLVSYMDWLLFRHATKTRATQNIGGIGNVTALPPINSNDAPVAFDTGPGNMIIDFCAALATNNAQTYDVDGKIAAAGRVQPDYLFEMLAHPYLHQTPPKTTGRELFGVQLGAAIWNRGRLLNISPEDIVATVTAFTAESIASAYRDFLPWPVDEVYVAGGGSKNPTLMNMIRARLDSRTQLFDHAVLGIPSVAKESVLFAMLAYETWHRRVGALPAFTGASRPAILGRITYGPSRST